MSTYNEQPPQSNQHVSDHLREAKTAAGQLKLQLVRLGRAFNSNNFRRAIQLLILACDAAIGAVERLDSGAAPKAESGGVVTTTRTQCGLILNLLQSAPNRDGFRSGASSVAMTHAIAKCH